ncbi:hypothetical protein TrCOL_g11002 [Triparma columacea]|uniref:Uncharacterized protein n=1 Tax=Triparma columacea TaxID=722753 RepID=A0A9W7L612_9STRA|nr:hypothetical protein TrCOL_g11002 [Triparma columacea]
MEEVKDLVKVLTTSHESTELETAAKTVLELGKLGVSNGYVPKLNLVEVKGLIGGLVRVMRKDGERFRVAREDAVGAIYWISYLGGVEVKKGLFKHKGGSSGGLIAGLVEILGQTRSEYKLARENAVVAINGIAFGADTEVLKGLFEHKGLIAGLVEILGLKGSEYKWVRENAVAAINRIANDADDEVKASLFLFPQLMSRIEVIIVMKTPI